MVRLKALVVAAVVALVAACGGGPGTEDAEARAVVEGVDLRGKPGGGGGGTCPQYLSCAYSYGAYDVFMYAVNNGSSIACWYRSSTTYQTASYAIPIPSACPHCCASGYCPDARLGQLTYTTSWTCGP